MRIQALLAGAALLLLPACQTVPAQQAAAEQQQDWTKTVSATPEGGFVMGNPNAPTKLVEFVSMSCSHCASFDAAAHDPLMNNYVRTGRVSYEIRNYVRDPFDIAAAVTARCAGPEHFFPLTHDLLVGQSEWVGTLMAVLEEQQRAWQASGSGAFADIGKAANLQKWASAHGVSEAQMQACLSDINASERLIQMNAATHSSYPEMTGVPSFLVNGKLMTGSSWPEVEAELNKTS